MKDEYDFSTAEQGKFYHSAQELDIPIYLDPKIKRYLIEKIKQSNSKTALNDMVNALLKNAIEISQKLT